MDFAAAAKAARSKLVVCNTGWAVWDDEGYPAACFVDVWLPLLLLAGVFLGIPIRVAWLHLARPSGGYAAVPTEDEDVSPPTAATGSPGNSPTGATVGSVADLGAPSLDSFWPDIQSTIAFCGVINFVVRFIGAVRGDSPAQDAVLSALVYLFAWTPYLTVRALGHRQQTALFVFSSFNAVAAIFKFESLRDLDKGALEIDDATAIGHLVISILLFASWALGSLQDLNERQERESYREAATSTSRPLPTLETRVSWFEQWTFSWVTPMVLLGMRRPLDSRDVWDLNPRDRALVAYRMFLAHAGPQGTRVARAIYLSVRHLLALQMLMGVVSGFLTFTGPFFLNRIVRFIESGATDRESRGVLWLYLLGLFLGTLFRAMSDGRAYFYGRRMGVRIKSALIAHIYSKVLRRRLDGASATVGETQTLFSVDVSKLSEYVAYMQGLIETPVALVISLASLYTLLGWSALCGVAAMIVFLPIQSYTARKIRDRQRELMKTTDERISLINELLQGIRVIKLCHYEPKLKEKLTGARETELSALLRFNYFLAFVQVIFRSLPIVVSFVTFASYAQLQGGVLDATKVFTALSLFTTLKGPLYDLPHQIVKYLEVRVSLDRVMKLLREEDLEPLPPPSAADRSAPEVGFTGDATFGWSSGEIPDASAEGVAGAPFHLRDLNIRFKTGGLNVVVGQVGSGKSSLLVALLGEMYTKQGRAHRPETVAYVAQTAWLQSMSIRENITFSSGPGTGANSRTVVDADRYHRVVADCALERDLAIFDHGDATQIGSRGVMLSGGTRQRIALARACYYALGADDHCPVLADSVLSAVDSPTALHIFNACILGSLAGRTRVLVTHAAGLVLPHADHIVVMDAGRVAAQGTLAECRAALADRPALLKLLDTSDADGESGSAAAGASLVRPESPSGKSAKSASLGVATTTSSAAPGIEEEEKRTGSVPWSVYKIYLVASGGLAFWAGVVVLQLAVHSMMVASDNVLRLWARTPVETGYLFGYAMCGIGQLVMAFSFTMFEFFGSMRASRTMHDALVNAVLRAPITTFFDKVPAGRVVNRFSKDIQEIDREVCGTISWFLIVAFDLVTAIALIAYVAPAFLLFLPPVAWMYWEVARRYLQSSRELKRLEATTKSPIYSAFSETLNGVPTIRAFGRVPRFLADMFARVDAHHRPWFYLWMLNRWLGVRTQALDATVLLASAVALVVALQLGAIDAGWAGIALTYALGFCDSVLWITRIHAAVEMGMNAVERVFDMSRIPSEAALVTSTRPPANWPARGEIVADNVCLQYPGSERLVLDHVSFTVPAGSRVGIVGRTGAGKSSLTLALFRIVELLRGRITIDGVDTSRLGLADLRSRLTIIPQDSWLLQGTLRSNLDLFSEYSDAELHAVLQRVYFPGSVSLDTPVAEAAASLSVGQRQLVALARALLRRAKIVVLDESTANLDGGTDEAIQRALRGEFKGSTVLTIAHRLKTIVDFDKILIFDQGRVVESGTPRELMAKAESDATAVFRKMCVESGDWEYLWENAAPKES
ncbi:Transporter of the ATP-binding cassette (ABC) [Blastocladiella emersonii ATCC 22665]|nr:Transporter of the ATP-binding cassette (ABC) [Blastocladiella emersonii ATCC 22665]